MNVHQVMTPSPLSVTTRTTVGQAWEALRSLDIRHLPVVNEDRELVGMLSDRDFGAPPVPPKVAELVNAKVSWNRPVTSIMSGEPLSIDADADVREVVTLMVENKIGAVPVTTPEGHVIGIVSYLDILRRLWAPTA